VSVDVLVLDVLSTLNCRLHNVFQVIDDEPIVLESIQVFSSVRRVQIAVRIFFAPAVRVRRDGDSVCITLSAAGATALGR
jgi:hypothetical protein